MAISKLTRKSYIRFILLNLLLALVVVYLHGKYRFASSDLFHRLHLVEGPAGILRLHKSGGAGDDLQTLREKIELYGEHYKDVQARALLQRLREQEPDAAGAISSLLGRSLNGPNIYQVAALQRLVRLRDGGGLEGAASAAAPRVSPAGEEDLISSALSMMVKGPFVPTGKAYSGKKLFRDMVHLLWEEDIGPRAAALRYPETLYEYLEENLRCVADKGQHSQTPVETYLRGAGDCEDHSIFAAYFLERAGLQGKVMLLMWDDDRPDNGHTVAVFGREGGYRFLDTCANLGMRGPFSDYDEISDYVKDSIGRPSRSYYIMDWDAFLEAVP